MKGTIFTMMNKLVVASLMLFSITFVGCDDEDQGPDGTTGDVTAEFSFTAAENTITFQNASLNADTYSWDFGDESELVTEENPLHVYTAAGTYNVVLTATNLDGSNSVTNEVVTQNGGPLASKIVNKDWVLARGEVFAYALGPFPVTDDDGNAIYTSQTPNYWGYGDANWVAASTWPLLDTRTALGDDVWSFEGNGKLAVDFNGTFWTEYHLWSDVDGANEVNWDLSTPLPNNAAGDAMSDFGNPNDNWTFEIDEDASTIAAIGAGAHIANPRFAYSGTLTDGSGVEVTTPQAEVWYDIVRVVEVEGAADTLVLFASVVDGGPLGQFITLHAYGEASLPDYLEKEVLDCVIGFEGTTAAADFTHTFASEDGSGEIYSHNGGYTDEFVADPAGGEGTVLKSTGLSGWTNIMLRAGISGECLEGATKREAIAFTEGAEEMVVKFDIFVESISDGAWNTLSVRWVDESGDPANFWQKYVFQYQNDIAVGEWVAVTFDFVNDESRYGQNSPAADGGDWDDSNSEVKTLAAAIADGTNVPDAVHIHRLWWR
ncbi:MAG: PKD domain-containing protein [Reichenbachiella sp.]